MKNFDLFAMRVQLNYKGRRAFNTAAGGFLSLILVLSFLAYAGTELNKNLTHRVLDNSNEFTYRPLTESYSFSTKNSTMVGNLVMLQSAEDQEELNRHLRIKFNSQNPTNESDFK